MIATNSSVEYEQNTTSPGAMLPIFKKGCKWKKAIEHSANCPGNPYQVLQKGRALTYAREITFVHLCLTYPEIRPPCLKYGFFKVSFKSASKFPYYDHCAHQAVPCK